MKLADLKHDLEELKKGVIVYHTEEGENAVFMIARRVASLYEDCPNCHAGPFPVQWKMPDGTVVPCPRCDGTGVVPKVDTLPLIEWIDVAHDLARYLFGKDAQ